MELAKVLNSWNMTLVGTVRKNKKFLSSNMQPTKERLFIQPISPIIVMQQSVHMCQKNKKAVVLLSSMHMSGEVKKPISQA